MVFSWYNNIPLKLFQQELMAKVNGFSFINGVLMTINLITF